MQNDYLKPWKNKLEKCLEKLHLDWSEKNVKNLSGLVKKHIFIGFFEKNEEKSNVFKPLIVSIDNSKYFYVYSSMKYIVDEDRKSDEIINISKGKQFKNVYLNYFLSLRSDEIYKDVSGICINYNEDTELILEWEGVETLLNNK